MDSKHDLPRTVIIDKHMELRAKLAGLKDLELALYKIGSGRQFRLASAGVLRTEATVVPSTYGNS